MARSKIDGVLAGMRPKTNSYLKVVSLSCHDLHLPDVTSVVLTVFAEESDGSWTVAYRPDAGHGGVMLDSGFFFVLTWAKALTILMRTLLFGKVLMNFGFGEG